jgi:DNA-binding MltR family transcriptional regulator
MNKGSGKKTSSEIGGEIMEAMDREFHDEPDRVLAVVGAAYLDSILDSLLRSVFVDSQEDVDLLMGPSGALGANGSRCQLAYCLGLITRDQRDDLKAIAKIRNKFAHDFRVTSFDMSPVRDYCASLKSPAELAAMPGKLFSPDVAQRLVEYVGQITATSREKFRMSVIGLFGALFRRVHYVRRGDHEWFSYNPDALRGPHASE